MRLPSHRIGMFRMERHCVEFPRPTFPRFCRVIEDLIAIAQADWLVGRRACKRRDSRLRARIRPEHLGEGESCDSLLTEKTGQK